VREGLRRIGALYDIEEDIREQKLTGEAKRLHRLTHSKPHVEAFFDWVDRSLEAHGLRPKNPFINALHYARERRAGLEVFLSDPDVSPDTNHLERALRVIPMGRKNWNFCWTELGAKHVGIVQSLIVTCRLHDIDVYTYLVDVLQRVAEHPASRVAELTPRLWKRHFAENPLRSRPAHPSRIVQTPDIYRLPLNDMAMKVLGRQVGLHPVNVFSYLGQPIFQVSTKAWYHALKRAGLENFRFHDLRHTWASWHVQNGTPLFALQELGGWETERMVRRYAHLSADHLAQWAGHAQLHGTFLAHPPSFLKMLDENVIDIQ
jgi:hypothetical protein